MGRRESGVKNPVVFNNTISPERREAERRKISTADGSTFQRKKVTLGSLATGGAGTRSGHQRHATIGGVPKL